MNWLNERIAGGQTFHVAHRCTPPRPPRDCDLCGCKLSVARGPGETVCAPCQSVKTGAKP